MINTIQAHVIGASRYKMDNGVQGAKISIMQAASAENENAIGLLRRPRSRLRDRLNKWGATMNDPSVTFVVGSLFTSYALGWAFGHSILIFKRFMESV